MSTESDRAGEVAVLSTWLCGLLPWSVSLLRDGALTAVWIRFLPGRFLFILGVTDGQSPYEWVWDVPGFVGTRGEVLASYAWITGVVVFGAAFVLSVAYYADRERVESWPLDPVAALGGLLLFAGGVFLVASGVLWWFGPLTVPVGGLFQVGLGAALVRVVDRPGRLGSRTV